MLWPQVLQLQTAASAEAREQEKKLKELEANWLKEEAELRAQEEEMLKQEKMKKQNAAKRAREISIRLKNQKEVKEISFLVISVIAIVFFYLALSLKGKGHRNRFMKLHTLQILLYQN